MRCQQRLSLEDAVVRVETEDADCDFSYFSQWFDHSSIEREVLRPGVRPWAKNLINLPLVLDTEPRSVPFARLQNEQA